MFISIDIGGTNSRIASFNSFENPRIQDIISFTHSGVYADDVNNIVAAIKKITDQKIEGIGLSIAGILNKDKSSLTIAPNLPSWMGQPIKADLEHIFHCPVVMDNDGVAAALGEARYGYGKGKDFVFLIWGTGIGGTAVESVNDKLHISPFEPGHYPQNWNGPQCGCGQRGCLEVTCGGAGIEKKYGKPAKELTEREWDDVISDFVQGMMTVLMIRPASLVVMSGSVAVKQVSRMAKMNALLKERLKVYDVPTLKISKFQERAGLYGALGLLDESLHHNV